jgi:hypothetical protein
MNHFGKNLIRKAKRMEDFIFIGISQQKGSSHYRLHMKTNNDDDDFFFVVSSSPRNADADLNNLHPRIRKAYRRRYGRRK